MSDPFLGILQAVRQLIDAELENLRAGIHRPGSRRSEVLRRREERMNELRGLLGQALQPGIDAGFRGETVEERLSAVGRAAEGVTHWDRMLTCEPGGVAYLDPGKPAEWHEVDSLDDQAEERLAELATRAQTALDGLQNLAIAAAPNRRRSVSMIKVLLLSANPIDAPLSIDEEFRAIDAKIRASEHRDHVQLIPHGAVRLEDIPGLLMRYKPHVVHFSGHGDTGAIELTSTDGLVHLVPSDTLPEQCSDRLAGLWRGAFGRLESVMPSTQHLGTRTFRTVETFSTTTPSS